MSGKTIAIASLVSLALIAGIIVYRTDGSMEQRNAMHNAAETDNAAMMQKEGATETGTGVADTDTMKDGAMKPGDSMPEKSVQDSGAMMNAGTYAPYSAEKLMLADSGDVVIFFHAPWCPICNALEREITSGTQPIPAGVTLLKVDFDSATELRKKYGVTVQHTFVQVNADGSIIAKWSDATSLAAALKKLQ